MVPDITSAPVLLLAVGFVGQWWLDGPGDRLPAPAWFRQLRGLLTAVAGPVAAAETFTPATLPASELPMLVSLVFGCWGSHTLFHCLL